MLEAWPSVTGSLSGSSLATEVTFQMLSVWLQNERKINPASPDMSGSWIAAPWLQIQKNYTATARWRKIGQRFDPTGSWLCRRPGTARDVARDASRCTFCHFRL
jgi:hypothetical protein